VTGVQTCALPISGTSPTNRCLLSRVGELAASAMLAWLERTDLDLKRRSEAYALFPDVDRDDSSLEGTCAAIVETAFEDVIEGKRYLLADTGELTERNGCVAFPTPVLEVWSAEQASALFDESHRKALCREIPPSDRTKLLRWQ